MNSISSLNLGYGGKANFLLAQYQAGNTDIILPFSIIMPSQERNFNGLRGLQIVRPSVIHDERCLVDLLTTKKNVSPHELCGAIDEIIGESHTEPIKKYANYDGVKDYQGVTSLVVQPMNPNIRGSVVEHPNIENHYLINTVRYTNLDRENVIEQYLTDSKGNIVKTTELTVDSKTIDLIKEIIKLKQRTREVKFIPDIYSSQLEFGVNQNLDVADFDKYEYVTNPTGLVLAYQERLFLPFDFSEKTSPETYRFNKFGVIPKEGLDLRVVKFEGDTSISNMDEIIGLMQDGKPSLYLFNLGAITMGKLHLDFQPNNMVGFGLSSMIITPGGNSLEHNAFRWVQKAQISLLGEGAHKYPNFDHLKTGDIFKLTNEYLPSSSIINLNLGELPLPRTPSTFSLDDLELPHPDTLFKR